MQKLKTWFSGLKWYTKTIVILIPLFYLVGMFSGDTKTNSGSGSCNCEFTDQNGRTKRTHTSSRDCIDLLSGTLLPDNSDCDVK